MARMMRITATKAVRYGGQRREAGESFEVRERDGRTLIAIRKATAAQGEMMGLAPGPSAAGPLFAEAADAGAGEPGADKPAEGGDDKAEGKGRRRYARRDMQAKQ